MKLHANAALSLNQRRRMVCRVVEQGWSLTKAAEAAEVSERTCAKWVGRYRAEGEAGLRDRSSAPRSIPHRTPPDRVEVIELLRRLRMTGAEIAECLQMAVSTVSVEWTRVRGRLMACAVRPRKDGVCRAENPPCLSAGVPS